MGRDKPTRVEGTPRGLGLYRRQGRDGFFFIKNWSHLAKEFPGAFERNGQFDEWLRRADGSLVDNLKEAKAYCQKRSGELEQRKLALKQPAVRYSGVDLEAISQSVANIWIKAWQLGANLQQLDLELWRLFMNGLQQAQSLKTTEENSKFFFIVKTAQAYASLEEEENKLRRLIWDQGYRPASEQIPVIFKRFGSLVLEHVERADALARSGQLEPPRPRRQQKSQTWQGLLEAKGSEGVAPRTLLGIASAAKRLENWASKTYQVRLPSSIDHEMALEYRSFLMNESGLRLSTAKKEMRFLSSLFASGTTHRVLELNPFAQLPKDRETSIRNSLATKKTIDSNQVISPEKGIEINKKMLNSKSGKDPSYDVFVLQAMTGARIQEIAGLRRCDFVQRRAGGKDYFCIQITAWSERGHGALTGMSGGLKTTASVRIVPLPSCAHGLWGRYADENNKSAAFPQERPNNPNQPWGGNLRKRMSDKCGGLQSKCWRETMSNNATNAGISYRAVEMVLGKTGESTVVQYTSDDLDVMQRAIEINANALQINKWLAEAEPQGTSSDTRANK